LVVFGRCTPREKEKIVSKMRGRVLAIGDGANDVSMLTKACVGVGIAGK
jgi:P-type E1-E2 ATPase